MKKKYYRTAAFLVMFIIVTGSVIFSCLTGPDQINGGKISVNTGRDLDGRIFTVRVFGEITSVVVTDMKDKSKKEELSPEDWTYDPGTTELKLFKEISFTDYIVSIEGLKPELQTFVLSGQTEQDDLMVIIGERLAIEGFDYFFDQDTGVLNFRDDVDLDNSQWFISYRTPTGGNSIGEWDPENPDQFSYLMAEHQKRQIDSWIDRQETFWFFDSETTGPEQKPRLVKRVATEKEISDMKNEPVAVWKNRLFEKNEKVLKEVSLSFVIPEKITTAAGREYSLWSKTIEEIAEKDVLIKKLYLTYEPAVPDEKNPFNMIDIIAAAPGIIIKDKNLLISEEGIDLGTDVLKIREWAMQSTDLYAEPEVIILTSWYWTVKGVDFYTCAESAEEEKYDDFIKAFIAAQDR